MNIKEYISSGIVESYVLGLATQAERDEFETLCLQYREIAVARDAFEASLEQSLIQESPLPPASLQQRIQAAVAEANTVSPGVTTEKQISPARRLNIWKWVAAASLVLMAGAVVWALSLNNQLQEEKQANLELQQKANESTARLNALRQEAGMLQRPGMRIAALHGTASAPGALATVLWDTTSSGRDVYLIINHLPQPASDQQYQLWALIDNQPVDLGVFDHETGKQKLLIPMKGVGQAQAFAITLEPRGGSPSPNMEAMMVHGEL